MTHSDLIERLRLDVDRLRNLSRIEEPNFRWIGPPLGFRKKSDVADDIEALLDRVEQFAKALESGDDGNVSKMLDKSMCCNGQDCGCQGSTNGEYLAYQLRETLK